LAAYLFFFPSSYLLIRAIWRPGILIFSTTPPVRGR
jgi:hypothetical protein